MASTTKFLKTLNLYRFDPIANFIHKKLQLSPFLFGLLNAVNGTLVYLLTAWASNTLWPDPTTQAKELLEDWFPWMWVLFIVPIVLGYYLWSFRAINEVIREFSASDVADIDESEFAEISQIIVNIYRSKWRKFLALASAAIFSIFVYITRDSLGNSWTSSHILPRVMLTAITFAVVYMGSILVLNLISNIGILHSILQTELEKQDFKINPLHPDKCGGLRCLSDYAIRTAYLAAVLGIMVGFIEYQFITQGTEIAWYVHLIVPLDILLSIVCFFGPLVAAHRGMKRAKNELLLEISKQFQSDYSQIHAGLTNDAETLQKGAAKIQELQAFYAVTNDFPIWPFDVRIFRQFLITVSSPLLPILVGVMTKVLGLFIKRWGVEIPL
ncbi:MAG: hypothetical protein AAFQ63_22625 [Cyanobacteria bacterium J06621_11]